MLAAWHEFTLSGVDLNHLSPTELTLVIELAMNFDDVVPRGQLVKYTATLISFRNHLLNLRRKLGVHNMEIRNSYGNGYRLVSKCGWCC